MYDPDLLSGTTDDYVVKLQKDNNGNKSGEREKSEQSTDLFQSNDGEQNRAILVVLLTLPPIRYIDPNDMASD